MLRQLIGYMLFPAQTADLGDAGLVLKPFHLSLDVFHGSAQAIDRRLGWDAIAVAGDILGGSLKRFAAESNGDQKVSTRSLDVGSTVRTSPDFLTLTSLLFNSQPVPSCRNTMT